MANFDLGKIIATSMGAAGKAYDQIIATGKELSKENQIIDLLKVEETVNYRIVSGQKVVAFSSLNPNIFRAFNIETILEALNDSTSGRLGIQRIAAKSDGEKDKFAMYAHLAMEPVAFQMAAGAEMDDDLCDIFKFKTPESSNVLDVAGNFVIKLLSFAQESGLPDIPKVPKNSPCAMFAGNNKEDWFLLTASPDKVDCVDAPSSWNVTLKSFFTDEEPFNGDIEISGPSGINWGSAVIDLDETKGTTIVGTPRIRLNTGTQKTSTVGVSAKMKKWDSVTVRFTSAGPVRPGGYQFTAVAYDGDNHGEGADKKVTFKTSKNFTTRIEVLSSQNSGCFASSTALPSSKSGVGRKTPR